MLDRGFEEANDVMTEVMVGSSPHFFPTAAAGRRMDATLVEVVSSTTSDRIRNQVEVFEQALCRHHSDVVGIGAGTQEAAARIAATWSVVVSST